MLALLGLLVLGLLVVGVLLLELLLLELLEQAARAMAMTDATAMPAAGAEYRWDIRSS